MGGRAPRFSVILAAGKGTRMQSLTRHKVCFPVDGLPVIHRALAIYTECGIRQHIIVVGHLAGQVVETAGKAFENVIFAYQAEPLGTAHAARQGLKALVGLESEQDILLVAGDRIIKSSVLEQLFDLFYGKNCDLAILALPGCRGSAQGRLVLSDGGRLLGVVETADIRQRSVFRKLLEVCQKGGELERGDMRRLVEDGFAGGGPLPEASRFEKAFGGLWKLLTENGDTLPAETLRSRVPGKMTRFDFIDSRGETVAKTPDAVEQSEWLNTSVYMVKISALQYALSRLHRDNAQQEEYLSDLVTILAQSAEKGRPRFCVEYLPVQDPTSVLGFNNPSELLEIEALLRSKREKPSIEKMLPAGAYRPVARWIENFKDIEDGHPSADERLRAELATLYSNETEVIRERAAAFFHTLTHAARVIGRDEKVFLVRSPGRVNVMGRHIDHQGGTCNLMTIGYETLMAVRPRADDRVGLFSVNPDQFPDRSFSIGEMVDDLPWDDWLSLVNSEKVSKMVHIYGGDWAQYIKAAVLRLQKKFPTDKLCGMDMVVSGNIPMAAGLSSSSSLVVGAAEATVAVNRLETFPSQLVDLCGEGEWFVGTRGGAADHAAVKLGQKGKVVKVTFFEFRILDVVSFPEDYVLAVCDSGLKAQKSGNAKDLFNHRISCYRIGFLLIKKFFPQYTSVLHHLRDVNTRSLNVPLSWIYKTLLHLPERATRDELRRMLPGHDLEVYFRQHNPPPDGLYPIRGVILFGLAEMERARLYADAMREGRIEFIGKLMNASHDGDRVISIDGDGGEAEYGAPTSNDYLLGLIEDLESGDMFRVGRAQLYRQPGSYHCSLPEIDRMVELSIRTPGVVGAQLAGAGLGGCMMVLTRREAVSELVRQLTEHYYTPQGKNPSILICRPVAGSDVLLRDGGEEA